MKDALVVRAEFIEPLNRVLSWMVSHEDSVGALICPFHRIEHTGKSAGALALACALARHDPNADRSFLARVARTQALRIVKGLEREGDSTCFTFRPGRHDPYNCSNSVIDGGACTDALVDCVETFGADLDEADREAFTRAAVLSAPTYLRYCIMDKGVPAQKAWAMTGAAQAFRLSGHEVLNLAVREGARVLGELQRDDGSYPYHPLESGAGHAGAGDASCYYQSRVTAFMGFALERAGVDSGSSPWADDLRRGVDFLLGLVGPDGVKPGLLEAKPWYHGASYEVASHPFDLYALGIGFSVLKEDRCAPAMLASFEAWAQHLLPSGEPKSHHPGHGRGKSYQCPMFWAAHASWVARALPMLEAAAQSQTPRTQEPRVRGFSDTGLVRLDSSGLSAWVRGPRPPGNLHHGSPLGAGLIRVVCLDGKELLPRDPHGRQHEGEWYSTSGSGDKRSLWARWTAAWRTNRTELRFSVWMMRNALRGGEVLRAAGIPWVTFQRGILGYGSRQISSAYDRGASLEVIPGGVRVRGVLAHADGTRVPGADFERSYRIEGEELRVEDSCALGIEAHQTVPKLGTKVQQSAGSLSFSLVPK